MITKFKRLVVKGVSWIDSYIWRVVSIFSFNQCRVCGGKSSPRIAYFRKFLVCDCCNFVFSVDTNDEVITQGMGMSGSQSGPGGGGYREYYLVKYLIKEFGFKKFLLFGTGNTSTFARLHSEGIDVTGCDISKDVVKFKAKEFGSESFMLPDDLPADYFDGVIAVEVFEHFADPKGEIQRLTACLRDGGIISGTTDFFQGGSIEDSNSPGYMSLSGHVAYWGQQSMSYAFNDYDLLVASFELIRPGSVLPDEKFGQLWRNKRVFFIYPEEYSEFFSGLNKSTPILPIDNP